MDYIEINRFTQEKRVTLSRDALYNNNLKKQDALRLIVYSCKRMYGIANTARIIHALGVKEIDLSV